MNAETQSDAGQREQRFQLVVVSGLSGSGKTVALHALEDAGFFCVDNLPSALVAPFARLARENPRVRRAAVAIDVRERSFTGRQGAGGDAREDWSRLLEELDALIAPPHVLYLDCDEAVLVQRFKTSRRPHPLVAQGAAEDLVAAIALERTWVMPFREHARSIIDTTQLTVHDLRRRVTALFGERDAQGVVLHLSSFGFKYGIPPEADFVFDVRFLENPYFVKELRDLTGLDAAVARFVREQPLAERMLEHVLALVTEIMPAVENEARASLTVAIGCTGGHHRSVALVDELGRRLAARGLAPRIHHRDIARGGDTRQAPRVVSAAPAAAEPEEPDESRDP